MKRFLCAALLFACSCSRSNLQAIDRMATEDASDAHASDPRPVDISDTPASDSRPSDVSDTLASDPRPADAIDTRSETCPSPAAAVGDSERKVRIGSIDRAYWLHIPSKYDGRQPVPLVFDFHVNNGSGSQQSKISPYPDVTDADGVVMAFPTGLSGPMGTSWNLGPCCVANVDDVAFTKAVIEQIQSTVCIDKKRIYAVGHITGGGMAYTLACQAADTFAGVAVGAWDLLEGVDCKRSRPITVVSFRGTADTMIPYGGGKSSVVPGMSVTFRGAKNTLQDWATLDGCSGEPSKEDSNGCSKYSNCLGGVEVVLCTKQGGGTEVSDPSIAWPLLKRHPMP